MQLQLHKNFMCTSSTHLTGFSWYKHDKFIIDIRVSAPYHVPSRCPVGKAGHTACSEEVASGDFLLRHFVNMAIAPPIGGALEKAETTR